MSPGRPCMKPRNFYNVFPSLLIINLFSWPNWHIGFKNNKKMTFRTKHMGQSNKIFFCWTSNPNLWLRNAMANQHFCLFLYQLLDVLRWVIFLFDLNSSLQFIRAIVLNHEYLIHHKWPIKHQEHLLGKTSF